MKPVAFAAVGDRVARDIAGDSANTGSAGIVEIGDAAGEAVGAAGVTVG